MGSKTAFNAYLPTLFRSGRALAPQKDNAFFRPPTTSRSATLHAQKATLNDLYTYYTPMHKKKQAFEKQIYIFFPFFK